MIRIYDCGLAKNDGEFTEKRPFTTIPRKDSAGQAGTTPLESAGLADTT